jgi:ATP-binding cassette subfamily B protein RaxB
VIHDPAGGAKTMSLEELSKHFTGVVLELSPAATFTQVTAPRPDEAVQPWSSRAASGAPSPRCWCFTAALQIAAFAMPFQMQLVVDEAIFRADKTCYRAGARLRRRW